MHMCSEVLIDHLDDLQVYDRSIGRSARQIGRLLATSEIFKLYTFKLVKRTKEFSPHGKFKIILVSRELFHDGRNVVVVKRAAQKGLHGFKGEVQRSEFHEVVVQVGLRKPGREIQRAVQAEFRGDVGEQIVDRIHADGLQHLARVFRGVLNVIHKQRSAVSGQPSAIA